MAYYDDIEKISKMLNNMCRPYFQLINNETFSMIGQNMTESLNSMIAVQNKLLLDESLTIAINNMRESMNVMIPPAMKLSESMQGMLETIRPTIEKLNTNLSVFQNNYASLVRGIENLGYNLSELAKQAYNEECCDDIEDFNSNEEIVEALQEQADNPIRFQEKFAEWSDAKKKKYFIVICIIAFIWNNFFGPYFQDTIGKPVAAYVVSKVREIPEVAGEIIDELKVGIKAIITEDVPYYYKVQYTDEEGNIKEGYVAKKNIEVLEDDREE